MVVQLRGPTSGGGRVSAGAGPRHVGGMLDRVLARLGAPPAASVESVFERWPDVVGQTLAARSRPLRIDGDTLVVACDEAALASHVRFLEPQLVARLAELGGQRHLRRIAVRVDGGRSRGPGGWQPRRVAGERNHPGR